ncbi:MAG TPA: serine hydrolase [Symbiobacteriaceae bacterium]|nr:serine hydrolase [Symbiobacteriaceae bacterium]
MVPGAHPLPAARAHMAELQRMLEQFRSRQQAKYGIYVEDLYTGLTVNLNGDDRYVAAGTTLFPVSLYAFYQASVGRIDLNQQVEYMPEDRTAGTGNIQNAQYGSRYTLRQLCYHAVVDSDNVAWRMLYRTLGEPAIKAWMRSVGGKEAVSGANTAAPSDYAVYFKFLLDFAERQPGMGGVLLDWLKKSGYTTWAPRHLPPAVPTAHKIGAWPTAVNDVGIVFLPRAPYLLCVMTDLTQDQRLGVAIDNLAHIGNMVYRHMRPQAGKFAQVSLNGRRLHMGLPGALMGGHMMARLQDMAEVLGASVEWEETSRTFTLTRGADRVELAMDRSTFTVNGTSRSLAVAPYLFEGQPVAPLRAVAEALGARVDWDPDRCRAHITL